MERIYGTDKAQNGIMNVGRRWIVFYGLFTDPDSGSTYEYRHTFTEKPSLVQIKEVITAQINADIDRKILSGFVWNGMPVWLSSENQFNYKAAYDLAAQTNGATLPVRFKFGTDDNPQYHTFNNLEELTDFYTKALAYVNATLNDGWDVKDSIDWSVYKC